MNKETIETKLKGVNAQIRVLEQERSKLEKLLIDASDSFDEKFRAWWSSDSKEHFDSIIKRGTPLRDWYDKSYDLDRYKTYDICEDLHESLEFILDPEAYKSLIEENPKWAVPEEEKELLYSVAKQMMEENIGSFECDW